MSHHPRKHIRELLAAVKRETGAEGEIIKSSPHVHLKFNGFTYIASNSPSSPREIKNCVAAIRRNMMKPGTIGEQIAQKEEMKYYFKKGSASIRHPTLGDNFNQTREHQGHSLEDAARKICAPDGKTHPHYTALGDLGRAVYRTKSMSENFYKGIVGYIAEYGTMKLKRIYGRILQGYSYHEASYDVAIENNNIEDAVHANGQEPFPDIPEVDNLRREITKASDLGDRMLDSFAKLNSDQQTLLVNLAEEFARLLYIEEASELMEDAINKFKRKRS